MTVLILCICGKSRNFWNKEQEFYGICPVCKRDLTKIENRKKTLIN